MGLVSEQSIYNLDNRMVELEVIPACRHYGLGLMPWSPLAAACWAARWRSTPAGGARARISQARVEAKRDQLERYEDLCRDLGHPPGEVALAWLLHNPAVTAPIIGPRTSSSSKARCARPPSSWTKRRWRAGRNLSPVPAARRRGLCLVADSLARRLPASDQASFRAHQCRSRSVPGGHR
jgi:diketogulonate reductase-like aldo/keto reductase